MDTRALLYGLIGFFLGGLLVAVAATTFNNEELQEGYSGNHALFREAPGDTGAGATPV